MKVLQEILESIVNALFYGAIGFVAGYLVYQHYHICIN